MPEGFFNRMNPPTRARDLLTAVVSVGIRFERLALKMSSTRAGRPRRVMDLFTVLKESTFNTSMAPSTLSTDELYGMPAAAPRRCQVEPFASKRPLAATSQGLTSPLARMGSVG